MTILAAPFPVFIEPWRRLCPESRPRRRPVFRKWTADMFFKRETVDAGSVDPGEVAEPETEEINSEEKDAILCAFCMARITAASAGIEADASHRHRFTNPQNLTFEIRCFRRTTNCVAHGEPTTEHTWFPGRAWQVATCAQCRVHLGWKYTGGDSDFFGLIADRLLEESP